MAEPIIDLADLIARMRLHGLSNPDTGPTPEDPENWTNIQAQLQGVGSSPDQMAQLQAAAQNSIMSQGGYMPQTVDPALAQTDPNAANAMLRQNMVNQLMQLLQGQQGAYDAASQQVADQYGQLTTPINTEGTGFLQQLYQGLGIDPATDPTAQQFMNTLSTGQNTAQLNQATDQAWFDKMKANNLITTQGLIQGISDGSIPIPGEILPEEGGGSGGGGGGGGRRGGGRGGGGGGSGGNWTNPKTTDALTQAAAADAIFQYPGFREDFVGAGQTPEEQETARRIAATYGGLPYNVNKGLSSVELPNAEAALDALTAQQAQRAAYHRVLSGGGREAQYMNEFQDLGTRQNEQESKTATDPGFNPLNTNEQARLRRLAEIALTQGIAKFGNKAAEQIPVGQPYDAAHAKRTGFERFADVFENVGRVRAQELDKEAYESANRPYSEDNPTGMGKDFTFKDWPGYVPNVDEEDFNEKWSHLDLLRRLTPIAEEYDPNAGWQETKLTQKDSTSTKTAQSSKSAADQLFNNNTDPGYVPYSQTEEEAAAMGGFGMGVSGLGNRPGISLSKSAQRIVADRAKRQAALATQRQAEETPAENVAEAVARVLPSWNKKPKQAPAPVRPKPTTAVESVRDLGANLFGKKQQPKKSTTLSKTVKGKTKAKVNKSVKGFF